MSKESISQVVIELKSDEHMTGSSESRLEANFPSTSSHGIDTTQQPNIAEISGQNQQNMLFYYLYLQRGILCTLLSTVFFATQGVIASFLKDYHSPTEVVAIRVWLIFSIVLPIVILRGIPLIGTKQDMKLLLLRSFIGTMNLVLKFFAYQNMRVGDATAIFFASPAFTGIFSRIFLKEPFHLLEMVVVVLSITGVVIVSQPPFLFSSDASEVENSLAGIIAAIAAMLLTSLLFVLMRAMGKQNIRPFQTIMYFAGVAGILLSTFNTASGSWTLPQCGMIRYMLVTIGVIGFFGQALITYVLTVENALIVSVFRTNQVIAAFVLEFLILGVAPNLLSSIGAILIVSSTLLLSSKKCVECRRTNIHQN